VKEKATFCEQKVAKKLCYSAPRWFRGHRPDVAKVFAPLFSKSGFLSPPLSFLASAFFAPFPGAPISAA
jgi:hypothetical protein